MGCAMRTVMWMNALLMMVTVNAHLTALLSCYKMTFVILIVRMRTVTEMITIVGIALLTAMRRC